ncbi:hypothetical protein [Yoonia sp. BS5-3]|uniref:SH3 domain-containing protein n=1 Tax=Yoonia phaeophyticola TaxID=3137369 RepID=A0ABZ2V4H7_9RHOB
MPLFRLTFVFLLWPFWVQADSLPPSLPALYAVTGVASDDSLNMRDQPNGSARILLALPHDATDLQVTQLSREGNWAYISRGEVSGWVAQRYLQRQPDSVDAYGLPRGLRCFGTEPFWTVRFTQAGLAVMTPERTATHPITFHAPSAENVALGLGGFIFEWIADGQPVRGHILPGRCSDGMSDTIYGLHYIDTYFGNAGCCSL